MIVYLDIIWLLNFLFDCLLLYLTGIILKRTFKKRNLFIAGFLGSLIVFSPFTPFDYFMSSPFIKILISILMVWIAFGYKRLKNFFTNLSVFYLITFAIGGALIGTHYLLSFNFDMSNSLFLASVRGFGDPISWIFVVLGFPIIWYLSRGIFDKWENVKIQYDQLVEVELFINHNTVNLKGLVDSGNQLYDPLTKKPVMIVSLEKAAHLISIDILPIFNDVNELWNKNKEIPPEWVNKISIIPYKVVGQDKKLIAGIKPDKIIIHKGEEALETNQLIIAFVNQKLSSDDAFDCIVHPKILINADGAKVS